MSSQSDILPELSIYERNRREAALFYCLSHKRQKGHVPENISTQEENESIQSILNPIVSFVQYIGGLSTIAAFVGAIIPFAGAYAVLVSAMYLYGYWSTFDFAVFDYLTLGDFITHAMPWFLPLLMVLMFIALIGMSSMLWRIYWTVFILIIMGIFIWYLGKVPSVYVDFIVFMALIYIPNNRKLLSLKTLLAGFLVLHIPLSAHQAGQMMASQEKQGKGILFVDLNKSTSQLPVDQDHRVGYLGRFGDFFVLYEMASDSSKAGKLIVVRTDKIENLVLMTVDQGLTKK
jgi:hypothetical protein